MGIVLRLAFFAVALVGLVLLFIYAAVVAAIFIPVMLVILFVLRRKGIVQWTAVDLRTARQRPQHRETVIDHDPNDVTLERKP
jgi:hypothetical protein